MRSKIVIQKPTDTSVGLIGVDSLLEVYDNTKSGDLVVVYPGTYDLGANGIKLKDGVNFLFMPGVVINSTNPNGAFYDDGVEIHCTIQGSPKIINGAGVAINLTNQSSSCPLNNKNLTVQNLPDPVLFNEGDIVTVEGGATYKHNGTTWKPLVDEYDFYYTIDTIQNATTEIASLDKEYIKIYVDFSEQNNHVIIDNGIILFGQKTLEVSIRCNYSVRFTKGILADKVIIDFPLGDLYLRNNLGFSESDHYQVNYHHELTALTSATVGQRAKITSQGDILYKLIDTDYTDLNNWQLQTTVNMAFKINGSPVFPKHICKDFEEDDAPAFVSSTFQNKLTTGDVVICFSDDVYLFRYLGNDSWEELSAHPEQAIVELRFISNTKELLLGVGQYTFRNFHYNRVTADGIFGRDIGYSTFSYLNLGKLFGQLNISNSIILDGNICNKTDGINPLRYDYLYIIDSEIKTLASGILPITFLIRTRITGDNLNKYQFLSAMVSGNSLSTLETRKIQNCTWIDGSPLNELIYEGILNQTGTNDLVVTQVKSDFGNLTWSRIGAGSYVGLHSDNAFPSDNVIVLDPRPYWDFEESEDGWAVKVYVYGENGIGVNVVDATKMNTDINGSLINIPIRVKVVYR